MCFKKRGEKKKKQNCLQEDNRKDDLFLVIKDIDLTKNNVVKSGWTFMWLLRKVSTDDVKNRIFFLLKKEKRNNWNCLPS